MAGKPQSLLSLVLLPFLGSVVLSQDKARPSRPRPTPHIAGRFVAANAPRGLITLQYERDSRTQTFTGSLQSTCMLPDGSKAGESKPLDLTTIPIGTEMTVFYVAHAQGKQTMNVILGVRFDRVKTASTLPVGVSIPCFKPAAAPRSK